MGFFRPQVCLKKVKSYVEREQGRGCPTRDPSSRPPRNTQLPGQGGPSGRSTELLLLLFNSKHKEARLWAGHGKRHLRASGAGAKLQREQSTEGPRGDPRVSAW